MGGTVYIHSLGPPLFLSAETAFQHDEWTRKGLSVLQQSRLPVVVRAGDPGVTGSGNWAQLPDGQIVGRSLYNGVYLCDRCGHEWRPVLAIESGM